MLKTTIVFDLDGTLIDSRQDIANAMRHAMAGYGLDAPPTETVMALIGRPLEEMFIALCPTVALGANDLEDLKQRYRQRYRDHCAVLTRVYPGVRETLTALRKRGHGLVVATTKAPDIAAHVCQELGLETFLDHIQGTPPNTPHKPAPNVVLLALAALGQPGAWMVGDTDADVLAGQAAGLKTLGLTWGTHDRATLQRANPDHIADTLEECLALLGS